MATKYCDEHEIWYDYKEGCPECHKFAKIASSVIGNVIGITIGSAILAGKKIHQKIKEDKNKKSEENNMTINSRIFCSKCGNKLFGDINFCPKCGAKVCDTKFC
jgi:membrane protease subunit (stomatin/prohibitin family)